MVEVDDTYVDMGSMAAFSTTYFMLYLEMGSMVWMAFVLVEFGDIPSPIPLRPNPMMYCTPDSSPTYCIVRPLMMSEKACRLLSLGAAEEDGSCVAWRGWWVVRPLEIAKLRKAKAAQAEGMQER